MGETGGTETIQLTEDQLPVHSHTGSINPGATANISIPASSTGTTNDPTNNYLGTPSNIGPETVKVYSNSPDISMQSFTAPVSGTVTTDPSGNGTAINNVQPFLAVSYIIAVEGINPS